MRQQARGNRQDTSDMRQETGIRIQETGSRKKGDKGHESNAVMNTIKMNSKTTHTPKCS